MVERMLRISLAAALALVLVLVAGGVALGDTTTVKDAQGDSVNGKPDIKSAVAGHTTSGKLQHTITTYAKFGTTFQAPRVEIVTATGDQYDVTPSGQVVEKATGQTAPVTVKRPNPTTIVYIFGTSAIGSPTKYHWQVWVMSKSGCDMGTCDTANNAPPDKPGSWTLHKL
jgi:hypothetical protein